MHHVQVIPYDFNCPTLCKEEAVKIQDALGRNCLEIHHIELRAIPGLVAQNIKDVDRQTSKMLSLGYEVKGEYGIPFCHYF